LKFSFRVTMASFWNFASLGCSERGTYPDCPRYSGAQKFPSEKQSKTNG
jgi:hypothetical protein